MKRGGQRDSMIMTKATASTFCQDVPQKVLAAFEISENIFSEL